MKIFDKCTLFFHEKTDTLKKSMGKNAEYLKRYRDNQKAKGRSSITAWLNKPAYEFCLNFSDGSHPGHATQLIMAIIANNPEIQKTILEHKDWAHEQWRRKRL